MKVFVINPGSTSTKLAVYVDDVAIAAREFQHDKAELARFGRVVDQRAYRMAAIRQVIAESEHDLSHIDAVAGRGGLLHPLQGGVYKVSDDMLDDLQEARYGEHPCNLGALLAQDLADEWGVPAYIVDPVVTDEMADVARITGHPDISRRSLFHALNQRGVARTVSVELGVDYETSDFIVCHMGGGISIGAHRQGKVVDVVNALDGEGPFSPERTGGLPTIPALEMAASDGVGTERMKQVILREGGVFAHLGTNDPREVVRRIEVGDRHAELVFSALAYNISKYISSLLPALADANGRVRPAAIVLTGGMARSEHLVNEISRLTGFVAPVKVVTGDEEMRALAAGAVRVLRGAEVALTYKKRQG